MKKYPRLWKHKNSPKNCLKDPSSVNRPFWKSPPQNQNKLFGEYNFSNKSKSCFQQRNQGYNIYNKGNYKNQGKYDSRDSNLLQDSISIPKGEVTIRSRTGIKSYFRKTTSKRANSRKVETLPECLADSNRGSGSFSHCEGLSCALSMSTSPEANSNDNKTLAKNIKRRFY